MAAVSFNGPSQRWDALTSRRGNLSGLGLLYAIGGGSHRGQDYGQSTETPPSNPVDIEAAGYTSDPTDRPEMVQAMSGRAFLNQPAKGVAAVSWLARLVTVLGIPLAFLIRLDLTPVLSRLL